MLVETVLLVIGSIGKMRRLSFGYPSFGNKEGKKEKLRPFRANRKESSLSIVFSCRALLFVGEEPDGFVAPPKILFFYFFFRARNYIERSIKMTQKEDFMSGDPFSTPQLVPNTSTILVPAHAHGRGSTPVPSPSSSPPKSSGSTLLSDYPPPALHTSTPIQPAIIDLPESSSSNRTSSLLDEPLSSSVPTSSNVSPWPIPTGLTTSSYAPLTSLDLASLFPPTPTVTPPASSTNILSNTVILPSSGTSNGTTRVPDILPPAITPPQTSSFPVADPPPLPHAVDTPPLSEEVSKRLSRSKEQLPALITHGKAETDMDMWLLELSEKQDRYQLSMQDLLREHYIVITKNIRERFTGLVRRNDELESETIRLKERIRILEVKLLHYT